MLRCKFKKFEFKKTVRSTALKVLKFIGSSNRLETICNVSCSGFISGFRARI